MRITLCSKLLLVSLEIREDKKNYIVESKSTGEFYEMPEICIDAIRGIQADENLDEMECRLKEKYPNEQVDILDFVQQLIDLGLIAEIDGVVINKVDNKAKNLGFEGIYPRIGKFFFNKFSLYIYTALFIVTISIFILRHDLFPSYKDIFIFHYMFFNILSWLLISVVLVLIHEFGHVLAVRAFHLPTKMEIGHRLFLVVMETDMSSAWKLASKERNILYLAGLCFDTVILFSALMGQLFISHDFKIFLSILQVITLDTTIRIIYQCCIYMKTDLYYVFENVTGCYNLMENAQVMLRKLIPFRKQTDTNEVVFSGEKRTIAVYSIFYVIGVFLTVTLMVFFYIPQLWYALNRLLPGFLKGPASLSFWDATVFALQLMMGLLLLGYSWRKKYLQS